MTDAIIFFQLNTPHKNQKNLTHIIKDLKMRPLYQKIYPNQELTFLNIQNNVRIVKFFDFT
ncbi:hypothetical protein G293_03060 [Candidatus Liberibacter africanus PTSAPSY]|uniref:Uncharacterized protein n=1 Tax=Candidatus Liberibacter africanus PTSAPSY TaxID=1277257 RepID=A0A0G3I4Q6_LIBAF|nr:hypothetical protein G293_03060 [Candidatus Liberibacter africanus PTSAPSY]